MTLHLDPDLAKHRTGREIMQKLEDTFGQPGEGGPCVELSQRLPMWPHRCATWSRSIHSTNTTERQDILYMLVCFTVSCFIYDVLPAQRREKEVRSRCQSTGVLLKQKHGVKSALQLQ